MVGKIKIVGFDENPDHPQGRRRPERSRGRSCRTRSTTATSRLKCSRHVAAETSTKVDQVNASKRCRIR